METLWSPWRQAYVSGAANDPSKSVCVFCEIAAHPADDETNFVLFRGKHNFIVLNAYPYISGHLMVAPYAHLAELDALALEASNEMMDLIKRSQTALRDAYNPQGFNLGMNLGRAAGAGIADHLHMHVLPRWTGDTNFMLTVGHTRVIPEDLAATYARLRQRFLLP